MTTRNFVAVFAANASEIPTASIFYAEDGGNRFPRNTWQLATKQHEPITQKTAVFAISFWPRTEIRRCLYLKFVFFLFGR
jgi:hypothetical protein